MASWKPEALHMNGRLAPNIKPSSQRRGSRLNEKALRGRIAMQIRRSETAESTRERTMRVVYSP